MAAAKKGVKAPAKGPKKPPPEEPDPLAGPPPAREKCAGKTAKGKPCPRWALDGSTLCGRHLNAGRGRPTKLTAHVADQIVEILGDGGYAETAAAAAGVSKSTFYDWIERGDPDGTKAIDHDFRVFRQRVDEARAKGEMVRVGQVAAAASDDWRAAAWMLEREFPDKWGGPRSRSVSRGIHPDDFAGGEPSTTGPKVLDDQVGPDGRPL